jgi:ribosomal protein S18 acetylase RimI-like enzyme
MEQGEAEVLHEGLRRSFAVLFDHVEGARLEQRSGYRLAVCPSMPFPGLNGVWVDGPDESTAVREIEAAIVEVESEAMPCWIELRDGGTPAVERIARRLGFTNEQAIPGMVARREEFFVVPGPKVEIERVGDRDGLGAAAAVAAAGFEAPPGSLDPLYTADVGAAPGLSIYLATADGRAVSTAISWAGDGGVGIFNVATPPGFRGRGYGRAVTQTAVLDAFTSGADLAWLQASEMGEPVYRAMGFRPVEKYLILGRPASA